MPECVETFNRGRWSVGHCGQEIYVVYDGATITREWRVTDGVQLPEFIPQEVRDAVDNEQALLDCGDSHGKYREWAMLMGYPYCEVVDWTSSGGDWVFIVSKDGQMWHPMYQEGSPPGGGPTTRSIDTESTIEADGGEQALIAISAYMRAMS